MSDRSCSTARPATECHGRRRRARPHHVLSDDSIACLETRLIYATSNDTTIVDDACDALPDDTPDLSPYVVVIRRGTCTFVYTLAFVKVHYSDQSFEQVTKLANIADKGATVALIYESVTLL